MTSQTDIEVQRLMVVRSVSAISIDVGSWIAKRDVGSAKDLPYRLAEAPLSQVSYESTYDTSHRLRYSIFLSNSRYIYCLILLYSELPYPLLAAMGMPRRLEREYSSRSNCENCEQSITVIKYLHQFRVSRGRYWS